MPDDKPYSPALLRALWADSSLTARQIADRLGITLKGLQTRRKRHGLPPRKGSLPLSLPRDELSRMVALGMSHAAIAEVFGCHWMTVLNNIRNHGLPRRGRGARGRMSAQQYRDLVAAEVAGRAPLPPAELRDRLLAEMRLAGVANAEIARALGLHKTTVKNRAVRLCLPRRPGGGERPLTLDDFTQIKLAQAMARRDTTPSHERAAR